MFKVGDDNKKYRLYEKLGIYRSRLRLFAITNWPPARRPDDEEINTDKMK